MNYFAVGVVTLQMLAALEFLRQGLVLEALLWASYGAGNIILILLAAKRLAGQ